MAKARSKLPWTSPRYLQAPYLRCFYPSLSLLGSPSSPFVLPVSKVAFLCKFPAGDLFFGTIPATDFTRQLFCTLAADTMGMPQVNLNL